MRSGTPVLVGLAILGRMNPIAILLALPLLLIAGAALLAGWLFIKAVELICRISRKSSASALPPRMESDGQQKC
jgi:hypothetical protein